MLDGSVMCNVTQKGLTIKVYFITSPPHDVSSNEVMSALTFSKQIADGKLASD